jgi:hypothetical protein
MAEQPSTIRGKARGYLRECNRMTHLVLVDWNTELYCELVLMVMQQSIFPLISEVLGYRPWVNMNADLTPP